jgi:hypothetical protein
VPLTTAVDVADGSQDRASGGAYRLFLCAAETIARSASFPEKFKISHGPLPHSIFLPFPMLHAGSCLVDVSAMPPLTTNHLPDGQCRGNGTRKLR